MNSTSTAKPEPTRALSQARDLIGLALLTPMPWGCNALMASFFWAALDAGLRLKGIRPTGVGGLFRPCFIVWTMPTPDRNPALRAVEQVVKEFLVEMVPWNNYELAFFDKQEDYWRTIHPYGAPPFGRFLTKDNILAAREQMAADNEAFKRGAAVLRSLLRGIKGEHS